jgi:hypothetical protein
MPLYHTEAPGSPRQAPRKLTDTTGPLLPAKVPKSPVVKVPVPKQEKIVVKLSRRVPLPSWMNPPGMKIVQRAFRA